VNGAPVRLVTAADTRVPDPDLTILADAVRARGCAVDVADWRDPAVDWAASAVTVLRSPWDYTERRDEFVEWARRVGEVSSLWNPFAVVSWNTHKAYLLDLEAHGVPVVPTVVLLGGSAASLDGICDARGWNTVVVKPAVGVGADGAGRFDVGDPAGSAHLDALLAAGDTLVQPFVTSIESDGEVSVVLVEGRVTHAIRKVPAPGEFRVHEHWGGRVEPFTPTAGLVELAERVVAAAPAALLYARVDMVATGGQWCVLELEATEPSLWLDLAPDAVTDSLAKAVLARLG
jgi:glutathione synthase/RimK-type ligase-like ATP-grasp enzyme